MDGVVAVGVIADSNGIQHGVIVKYDLNGNEIFRHKYDKSSTYYSTISSKYVNDKYDGYIVAGVSDEGTFILKYDYDGNIVYKDIYSKDKYYNFKTILNNYDYTGKQNGYILISNYFRNEFDFIMPPYFALESKKATTKKLSNVKRMVSSATTQLTIVKYTYPVYDIIKDNTDEGEIAVGDNAYPGEVVRISVTPKEGYSLKRIVVIDESGKEIEVSSDGTFVMPEGKVIVTAIYNRISNPETVSACYVVLGIILFISIGTLIVSKKREENLN